MDYTPRTERKTPSPSEMAEAIKVWHDVKVTCSDLRRQLAAKRKEQRAREDRINRWRGKLLADESLRAKWDAAREIFGSDFNEQQFWSGIT